MSAITAAPTGLHSVEDPHRLGRDHAYAVPGHGADGPADKRIIVGFGFWLFLLSDIVMFSAIFAGYAVLHGATAGGPGGRDLFDLRNVAIETGCLLLSSFTCGMAMIAANRRSPLWAQLWLSVTFALGFAFLYLELREFGGMIAAGAGPQRSAFLSSFFTLVGCHGLHVTCGLVWLVTMMAQVSAWGFEAKVLRRLMCFSLFWHVLDIIWIGIFTLVYLMGVA
jgi:cytochrome o ubiquinol oxidase subunit 3